MRILLHDYSGHPFQAQLSRELAARGHVVEHVHCASYVSGKGRLERRADDPASLSFVSMEMDADFDKYKVRHRVKQEFAYARAFSWHLRQSAPDVVVMCNVPLLAHFMIERRSRRRRVPTVFWQQDVYSHAIGSEARRRLGPIGSAVAVAADRLERDIARRASAVVAIADTFLPVHDRWGTPAENMHIIPNWGPLDEITPRDRHNSWAHRHGLTGSPVMLYSGTLGLKHNPDLLVDLLRGVRRSARDARLVVVSEGRAATYLASLDEPGLEVLPFQPFGDLSDVLASGDVLVTILEPDASTYSVPSKTLSYLCAGRPVVGLLPASNPAYAVVNESGGLAIDLARLDMDSASRSVAALLTDSDALAERGRRARGYAEATFDVVPLARRFEQVFLTAAGRNAESSGDASTVPASPVDAELVLSGKPA
jgi:colanic acid biosynthesis glycosyl transferase WcaI